MIEHETAPTKQIQWIWHDVVGHIAPRKKKTKNKNNTSSNGYSSSHATFIPGNKAFLIGVLRDNDGEFHPVLTRRVFLREENVAFFTGKKIHQNKTNPSD